MGWRSHGKGCHPFLSLVLLTPTIHRSNIANVSESDLDLILLHLSCLKSIRPPQTNHKQSVHTFLTNRTDVQATLKQIDAQYLAVHCHDTYGMAVANILAALRLGISVVDSSVAGLGGCPYARGATGNVATEDVLYLLDGYGIEHGIDMDAVLLASDYISSALGRPNGSRVARALLARRSDSSDRVLKSGEAANEVTPVAAQ